MFRAHTAEVDGGFGLFTFPLDIDDDASPKARMLDIIADAKPEFLAVRWFSRVLLGKLQRCFDDPVAVRILLFLRIALDIGVDVAAGEFIVGVASPVRRRLGRRIVAALVFLAVGVVGAILRAVALPPVARPAAHVARRLDQVGRNLVEEP